MKNLKNAKLAGLKMATGVSVYRICGGGDWWERHRSPCNRQKPSGVQRRLFTDPLVYFTWKYAHDCRALQCDLMEFKPSAGCLYQTILAWVGFGCVIMLWHALACAHQSHMLGYYVAIFTTANSPSSRRLYIYFSSHPWLSTPSRD
jgi:hypothetical protein